MRDISFLTRNYIAHRGFHNEKNPENSIGAFKKAINSGYIIELDVHMLSDNTVVVFHDDSLYRMTHVKTKIKDYSYEELKKIKLLDSKYSIPTLSEVLNLVDGKVPLIIELKYDLKVGLLENEVVKLLDNYKGEFCVKSFSPLSVYWFRKHRPNYIRGLLIGYSNKTFKQKFFHSRFVCWLCKPDFISCNYMISNKMINRFKRKRKVIAWTIRNDLNFLRYKSKFDNLIFENIKIKK